MELKVTNIYRVSEVGSGTASQPFTAESPRDAWNIGRSSWAGPEYRLKLIVLERMSEIEHYSPMILSQDITPGVLDKQTSTKLWVRIATGIADSGWVGEPPGGLLLEVSPESRYHVEVGPGHDPLKCLRRHFDDDFIREGITRGLADGQSVSTYSVCIQFSKNESASDNFGMVQVSTTRENWLSALRQLESSR